MAIAKIHETWVNLYEVVIEENEERRNASDAIEVISWARDPIRWWQGNEESVHGTGKAPDEGSVNFVE